VKNFLYREPQNTSAIKPFKVSCNNNATKTLDRGGELYRQVCQFAYINHTNRAPVFGKNHQTQPITQRAA
jgi:hypothetical protein